MSSDKPSENKGLSPLALWVTIGIVCFGVGLTLYIVKQDQDAKERARLELEAKCASYEEELSVVIKRTQRYGNKASELLRYTEENPMRFYEYAPEIKQAKIEMDETFERQKSITDAFKAKCGEGRVQAWYGANLDRLKSEAK